MMKNKYEKKVKRECEETKMQKATTIENKKCSCVELRNGTREKKFM
jgi:hypothetical protein